VTKNEQASAGAAVFSLVVVVVPVVVVVVTPVVVVPVVVVVMVASTCAKRLRNEVQKQQCSFTSSDRFEEAVHSAQHGTARSLRRSAAQKRRRSGRIQRELLHVSLRVQFANLVRVQWSQNSVSRTRHSVTRLVSHTCTVRS
jgi:hypothetical protein